ncbi:MAG: hypothetical protein LBR15_05185 [Methanobrevibacter sp.]|jgi:hypothetical protein|nr:hypothetical protein [Candidatus Methanovirga australis]
MIKKFFTIITLIIFLSLFSLSGAFNNHNDRIDNGLDIKLNNTFFDDNFNLNDQIGFLESFSDMLKKYNNESSKTNKSFKTNEIINPDCLDDNNRTNVTTINNTINDSIEVNDSIFYLKSELPKEYVEYNGKKLELDPKYDSYYYTVDNFIDNETVLNILDNGTFVYKSNNTNISSNKFFITVHNPLLQLNHEMNLIINKNMTNISNNSSDQSKIINVTNNVTNLTLGDTFGIHLSENADNITLYDYNNDFFQIFPDIKRFNNTLKLGDFVHIFKCNRVGNSTITYKIYNNNEISEKRFEFHVFKNKTYISSKFN